MTSYPSDVNLRDIAISRQMTIVARDTNHEFMTVWSDKHPITFDIQRNRHTVYIIYAAAARSYEKG